MTFYRGCSEYYLAIDLLIVSLNCLTFHLLILWYLDLFVNFKAHCLRTVFSLDLLREVLYVKEIDFDQSSLIFLKPLTVTFIYWLNLKASHTVLLVLLGRRFLSFSWGVILTKFTYLFTEFRIKILVCHIF